jgi:hypothetical protein
VKKERACVNSRPFSSGDIYQKIPAISRVAIVKATSIDLKSSETCVCLEGVDIRIAVANVNVFFKKQNLQRIKNSGAQCRQSKKVSLHLRFQRSHVIHSAPSSSFPYPRSGGQEMIVPIS